MIIQELCHYYDRLAENPDISISPPGFSREKIHAEIVLDKKGHLLQFNDLRLQKGRKLVPRDMIVPQAFKRTISTIPNFLWDNTSYVLGADNKDNPQKAAECFNVFRQFHSEMLNEVKDTEISAVLTFLNDWNPQNAVELSNWDELAGGNVVFRIDGERQYLHEKNVAKQIWLQYKNQDVEKQRGFCLVTGENQPIARLHPPIKGVRDAQSSGAALITFNLDSFCSYCKEQNFNAPVGEISAFSYATALNYLLANDSRQKIQIGDATTVFWTERESPIEGMFGMMLDPKDLDLSDNAKLRQALESIRAGKPIAGIDHDIKFFILGLSPNAARIAVRFWYVCTVGQLEDKIGQHFRDLNIQRNFDSDPEYPGIWRLLRETVNPKASDKSPQPLLAGAVLRSILEGTAYPQALQNAVINRIRADQEINYVRAAILKAILVRKHRLYKKQGMEVSMALDTENKNPAYLLGRLFAVLEKAQQEASPGLNATIKDRFWGAASATPKVVFPQLLNLNNHHISKMDHQAKAVFFEKLVGSIMEQIESTGFRSHLTLDEQGLFAIGYYHQRQDFFKSKESRENNQ